MDIRTATPDDVPGIRRVADRAWHDTYSDILAPATIDTVLDDWYAPGRLQDEVQDPGFLVAVQDRTVHGFTHLTVDGPTATLHRIYVSPDRQGAGTGTALLDRALAVAREQGAGTVRAEVLAANDQGRAFYASRGFTAASTGTVDLGGGPVEQVVMEREP